MHAELPPSHPVIRPLQPEDLDRVMAIEEAAYPWPWTRGIFSECLRVGYGCYGLLDGGELVAYVVFNWGAGETHLLNLCVDPARQRSGMGQLLLEFAIERTRQLGCEAMFLEVRPSNPAAIALYRRRGFAVIGRRPDYYRSDAGREDAIVMRLSLEGADEEVERLLS